VHRFPCLGWEYFRIHFILLTTYRNWESYLKKKKGPSFWRFWNHWSTWGLASLGLCFSRWQRSLPCLWGGGVVSLGYTGNRSVWKPSPALCLWPTLRGSGECLIWGGVCLGGSTKPSLCQHSNLGKELRSLKSENNSFNVDFFKNYSLTWGC
jgi:hypothetical protein